MFQVTRLFTDENGDSRFEEISIPLKEAGEIGKLSEGHPVTSIIFREVESTYDYDFHNAPQKQYLILIDGGIEIETCLVRRGNFTQEMFFCWRIQKGRATGQKTWSPKKEDQFLLPFEE